MTLHKNIFIKAIQLKLSNSENKDIFNPVCKSIIILFAIHKYSCDIIYPIAVGDQGVYTFPKSLKPKMKVIGRLEFELVYFKAAVQLSNTPRRLLRIHELCNIYIYIY